MSETRPRFSITPFLVRLFSIDLRALGVFRILLAIVLLVDIAGRLPDLDAHYTEAGVMPLKAAQLYHNADLWLLFSPYVWNGSHDWSLFLMLLTMAASLFLLVGWRTRLANFVIWYLVIGLHTRYPLVQEGSDVYIRQLLFWSMFLPLGARYAVDGLAARHVAHRRPLPRATLSMASAGILLQIAIVYWFNAIAKNSPQWRTEFTAIYYALNLDAFTTPFGGWVRDHLPWSLKPLTMATIFLESFGPFFAYFPVATERIRTAVVVAFFAFHLGGIGLCMDVGAFHYVAALPWVLYLPGPFWDAFGRAWTVFPLSVLTDRWNVVKEKLVLWRSERIAAGIQRGDLPPRLTLTLPGQVVAFFFFVFVIHWNLRDTGVPWAVRYLPPARMEVVWLTRLDQFWGMFAPFPMTADAWVVIPAKTIDGTEFDMYKMATPVNYSKPRSVHEFYKNTRWRKYLTNLYDPRFANQRGFYCDWLVNEWNRTHAGPQKLVSMWYCVVEEATLPNFQQPKRVLRVLRSYVNYDATTKMEAYPPGAPPELLPEPLKKKDQGVAPHGADRSSQPEKNL